MNFYEIDEKRAKTTKSMWSFNDYIDGSITNDYQNQVKHCYKLGEEAKKRAPKDKHDYIDYLCDKYSKKMACYHNKEISIQLMCPSVMICGAGNFPLKKKEKQNNASDKNRQYYSDIQEILTKISNIGTSKEIIKAGDALAIEKLQDKIETFQKLQDKMKACNAYYRKHKTLYGYDNLIDDEAAKFDEDIKNTWYEQPYATFELTNNNNKIKKYKLRLEKLLKVKEKGNIEFETDLFKVVQNAEIMQMQLLFENKPSEKIRSILKSHGFRWSQKNYAWQRQLTNNAIYATKQIINEISEVEE